MKEYINMILLLGIFPREYGRVAYLVVFLNDIRFVLNYFTILLVTSCP